MSPPKVDPAAAESPRRVLIVEEDRVEAGVLALHLRRQGYQTLLATSAGEVDDAIGWAKPDVVLCELGGSDIDGLELAARLSGVELIYALVADRPLSAGQELAALRAGISDVFHKPIDADAVLARLRTRVMRPLGRELAGIPDGGIGGHLDTRSVIDLLRLADRHDLDARVHLQRGDDWTILWVKAGRVIAAEGPEGDGRDAALRGIAEASGAFVWVPLDDTADDELERPDSVALDTLELMAEAFPVAATGDAELARPAPTEALTQLGPRSPATWKSAQPKAEPSSTAGDATETGASEAEAEAPRSRRRSQLGIPSLRAPSMFSLPSLPGLELRPRPRSRTRRGAQTRPDGSSPEDASTTTTDPGDPSPRPGIVTAPPVAPSAAVEATAPATPAEAGVATTPPDDGPVRSSADRVPTAPPRPRPQPDRVRADTVVTPPPTPDRLATKTGALLDELAEPMRRRPRKRRRAGSRQLSGLRTAVPTTPPRVEVQTSPGLEAVAEPHAPVTTREAGAAELEPAPAPEPPAALEVRTPALSSPAPPAPPAPARARSGGFGPLIEKVFWVVALGAVLVFVVSSWTGRSTGTAPGSQLASPTTTPTAQAAAALQAREYERAEGLYRQVLASEPGDAAALRGLSVTLVARKRPDHALAPLRQLSTVVPDDPRVVLLLDEVLTDLGRPAEGVAALTAFLDRHPGNPVIRSRLDERR